MRHADEQQVRPATKCRPRALPTACRYLQGQLIEVNAHSLFSKWFSESGKLVSRLFAKIQEAVEEEDTLVFVLIDEVGLGAEEG